MTSIQVQKCSICKKPISEKFRPFCSSRCANIDLGRWFGENYTAPAASESEDLEGFYSPEKKD